ncbi:MAG TPA: crossover junction endodeoxyribonuclease RuvC [Anaerolineaceae bacterium]|nr:crossover junction endodeoxyribonuclease RuvC [Anaerolineaceae bacterium]
MLVLGIDPGTAITGYGLVKDTRDGLQVVDYGVILTPKDLPLHQRLFQLHTELTKIILLHHPDAGAVEKLFFQRNVTTAMSVGHARGVVFLAMAQACMPVAEYTPMQVKEAVAGYGGAEKRQIQEMVRVLLGLNDIPKPDDAADALAVAICHLHSYRLDQYIAGMGDQ